VGLAPAVAALAILASAACRTVPIDAEEVPGIDRVVARYRGEADVHRVGQTFLGDEPGQDGTDVLLLTDPASHVGYYFRIALDLDPPAGSRIRMEIVETENQPPVVRDFPLPRNPGGPFGEFVIGLTGASARSPKWHPVAWRASVVGPDGAVLAARRSFLWGAPRDLGK
jgi:hypothetical protein